MEIGMLWFDNDKKDDVCKKVERAAKFYRDKYGHTPNLCFVNPCMLSGNGEVEMVAGVELRTAQTMLPHHFWIGVADNDHSN